MDELAILKQRILELEKQQIEQEKKVATMEDNFRKAYLAHPGITGISTYPGGRFLAINNHFTQAFGWSKEEVIDRTIKDLDFYYDFVHREEMLNHLDKHGFLHQYEIDLKTKTGECKTVEFNAEIIEFNGEKCLLSQINDITDKKKLSQKLYESDLKFKNVFEECPIGIELFDSNGLLVNANQACLTIFGVKSLSAVKDFNLFEDPTVNEEYTKEIQCGNSVKYETKFDFEIIKKLNLYQTSKSGSAYLLITITPLNLIGGIYPESYLVLVQDITDKKNSELKLKKMNEELEMHVLERTKALEDSKKELETFSYSISHDLRAPLRAISGYSKLIQEICPDSFHQKCGDYLGKINQSAQHMTEMVKGLLALSRLTKSDLHIQTVNLSDIASRIIHELQNKDPQRVIEFTCEPLQLVDADEALIELVLENFLENAWKYSSKKDKSIIKFGSTLQDKQKVFYIQDNGAGFDMHYANKLFVAFQRLHADSEFVGIGIGLVIVQKIIQRHGGRVWVDSKEGIETTFYFTLG